MNATHRTTLPRGLKAMNRVVTTLYRLGVRIGTIHLLTVPGRKSGQPRTTPVSPYLVGGNRYLLGGIDGADWVRNVRAAGTAVLARGKREERVRLVELPVGERGPILRAFPREVPHGVPMMIKTGLVEKGTPEEFEAVADRCTVFRVEPV
ncbi:nitroreductase/quinone reductase family protein [Amycolatopsis samaneae]|uniref:Nitroreductase/quinone reductase family protein n=1 Tax=Amycolatopsis samaneae TaxID=664691 RepID=A0ABW5GE12_9PSEU